MTEGQGNRASTGLVTMVVRGGCKVRVDGQVVDCIARNASRSAGEPELAVGDEVTLMHPSGGLYLLESVLPRRTSLSKADPRRPDLEQVIAANIDLAVLVVTITEPSLRISLVDRFLVASRISGITPLICVNKIDLLRNEENSPELSCLLAYNEMGVEVVVCSVVTGRGIDRLAQMLQGKRSVLIGQKGVGKTSLIDALFRDAELSAAQPQKGRARGRSATMQAILLQPKPGIEVIDTSGLRDFGIRRMTAQELQEHFPEFRVCASGCERRDCTHTSELNCAVKRAVHDKSIRRSRYESYLQLLGEDNPKNDKSAVCKRGQKSSLTTSTIDAEGPFRCANCGEHVGTENAGTHHRNHCPNCLYSLHLDNRPGDRSAHCGGLMEPIAVWVRHGGEWALIHRCKECGALSSNRIAADDNEILLLSLAVRPLSSPPFPLNRLKDLLKRG